MVSKLRVQQLETLDGSSTKNVGELLTPDSPVTTSTGEQTLAEAFDHRLPYFNSVADMVASTPLYVGAKVQTLGYYSPGDGGGNDYEIVAAGTGTDDGGSFIDLSGSGFQAKGLFPSGEISPLKFGAYGNGVIGANRDDANDDSAAIEAALNFVHKSDNHKTLNLSGRTYGVSSPIVCDGTPAFFNGKRVTNGTIQVKSDFSPGPIFDFTNVGVSRRATFDNLYIVGGSGSSVSEAKGGIIMRDVYGTYITQCEMRFIDGPAIQFGDPLNPGGPAAGAVITGNRLFGGNSTGDTASIGVEANKGDCEVISNIICVMAVAGVYSRVGAITIRGNHIWMHESRIVPNILSEKAEHTVIVGNYIDNGPVQLDMTGKAPNNLLINSNKFVAKQTSIDNWNANSPAKGYIELGAYDVSDAVMRSVSIQGNVFRNAFNPTTDVTTVQCRTPANFISRLREVYVKDNAHDDLITVRTTHPRIVQSFSDTSSVSVDMNNSSSSIRRLPGPWSVTFATSVVYQSGSAGSVIHRVSRSGDVFTVNIATSTSGDIILTASSNEDGA